MVDAKQSMTAAVASLDPYRLEEPLPADDVSLYSIAQFRDYLHRGAASIVQPDVARIGGTPWLKAANLAEALNVDVCSHFPMEPHVSGRSGARK